MLWLQPDNGGEPFTVAPEAKPVDRSGEPPEALEGFTRLNPFQRGRNGAELGTTVFGIEPELYQVHPQLPGRSRANLSRRTL